MGKKEPRVDAYIAKSADFATPILTYIRDLVHTACPDVEEEMKWGMPFFVYKGVLCSIASFKSHCALAFWKGALVVGKAGTGVQEKAMGQFGRITSIKDLPPKKVLLGYVKEAVRLNKAGLKSPTRSKPKVKTKLTVPNYFTTALKRSKKALATFKGFNYSNKKDYVEWITEAKTEETRQKRLETAIEWMAAGKVRNWKYIKK